MDRVQLFLCKRMCDYVWAKYWLTTPFSIKAVVFVLEMAVIVKKGMPTQSLKA